MNEELCNALKIAAQTHGIWGLDQKLGNGGGEHNVYTQYTLNNIIDNNTDIPDELHKTYTNGIETTEATPTYLQPYLDVLVQAFKSSHPDVAITSYTLEHRSYVMRAEPFIGKLHSDYCEYTTICYYEIGTGICGGQLNLYSDDEKLMINLFTN